MNTSNPYFNSESEVAKNYFAKLKTMSSMERFDKISGNIGQEYEIFVSEEINVDNYPENQIQQLLKQGYKKYYGYVKGGKWATALFDSIKGISLENPDPKITLKYEEKGYKIKKELHRSFFVGIDKFEWINDPIEINSEKVKSFKIYFQWDRFSTLPYLPKVLTQDNVITYVDVLNFVDGFYKGILSKEELSQLKDTDDCFGYYEIAKKAFEKKKEIQRLEVMGDCKFFEGFTKYKDGWRLDLGS